MNKLDLLLRSWLCLVQYKSLTMLCTGFGLTPMPTPTVIDTGTSSILRDHDSIAIVVTKQTPPFQMRTHFDSIPHLPSQILATATTESTTDSWSNQLLQTKQYKTDKVKRVIDASTIQLEKGGYVSLETVRGVGSTYQLPDCMTYAPSYKLKQLLKKGTVVRLIYNLDDVISHNNNRASSPKPRPSSSTTPRVWIIRDKDNLLINEELVRSGFGIVRKGSKAPRKMMNDLIELEQNAKQQGLGIYKSCTDEKVDENVNNNSIRASNFVAEFEPLDYTTEIEYGDDGGKSVIVVSRKESTSAVSPPSNPGDTKGCSDFETYEESLKWYETYFPYYGDVARLDRNDDGVPCPGLPHTTQQEKYRIKRPNTSMMKTK